MVVLSLNQDKIRGVFCKDPEEATLPSGVLGVRVGRRRAPRACVQGSSCFS